MLIAVVGPSAIWAQNLFEAKSSEKTPTLVGRWKSDLDRTMDFNTKNAKLEESQIEALSQIFGKNTLTFTVKECIVHSPKLSIRKGNNTIDLDESTDKISYRVVATAPSSVAIWTKESEGLESLSIWHFEGEYVWTYLGDSPLHGMHLREYFRRIK
jgi:hypothetical protein